MVNATAEVDRYTTVARTAGHLVEGPGCASPYHLTENTTDGHRWPVRTMVDWDRRANDIEARPD